MASDVERIASIIGNNYSSEPEFDYRDYLLAAEALVENGFGHVPTALHQAADEADDHAAACPEGCNRPSCAQSNRTTAKWLRARADRAGGRDE